MIEDKVYTQDDLRRANIITTQYRMNMEPGDYIGTLDLKAITNGGHALRVFFTLEDGRQIISLAQWWQVFLGFFEIPLGSTVCLHYERNQKGEVYLTSAERIA